MTEHLNSATRLVLVALVLITGCNAFNIYENSNNSPPLSDSIHAVAWSAVDTDWGDRDHDAAFALLGGLPAYAYFIETAENVFELRLVRALDVDCMTWSEPVPITVASGTPCCAPRLCRIGDRPAVTFADTSAGHTNAYFACAVNSAGSSWQSPVLLCQEPAVSHYRYAPCLMEFDGRPVAAYTVNGPTIVPEATYPGPTVLVRPAADKSGTSWNDPQVVSILDQEEDMEVYPQSLEIINGLPAMLLSGRNLIGGVTYAIRANTPDGSVWGEVDELYQGYHTNLGSAHPDSAMVHAGSWFGCLGWYYDFNPGEEIEEISGHKLVIDTGSARERTSLDELPSMSPSPMFGCGTNPQAGTTEKVFAGQAFDDHTGSPVPVLVSIHRVGDEPKVLQAAYTTDGAQWRFTEELLLDGELLGCNVRRGSDWHGQGTHIWLELYLSSAQSGTASHTLARIEIEQKKTGTHNGSRSFALPGGRALAPQDSCLPTQSDFHLPCFVHGSRQFYPGQTHRSPPALLSQEQRARPDAAH